MIFGEVGLTGEVRGVSHVEQRLAEAIKMGFTRCIMPKTNAEVLGDNICQKIQVIGVSNERSHSGVMIFAIFMKKIESLKRYFIYFKSELKIKSNFHKLENISCKKYF